MQETCKRVVGNLCDAMGEDGCTALLARALAATEAQHPPLRNIRRVGKGSISLDGVVESVETHGVAAVTAAVEALFAALVDVLGRLIGEDMAIRIMELEAPGTRRGDRTPPP